MFRSTQHAAQAKTACAHPPTTKFDLTPRPPGWFVRDEAWASAMGWRDDGGAARDDLYVQYYRNRLAWLEGADNEEIVEADAQTIDEVLALVAVYRLAASPIERALAGLSVIDNPTLSDLFSGKLRSKKGEGATRSWFALTAERAMPPALARAAIVEFDQRYERAGP